MSTEHGQDACQLTDGPLSPGHVLPHVVTGQQAVSQPQCGHVQSYAQVSHRQVGQHHATTGQLPRVPHTHPQYQTGNIAHHRQRGQDRYNTAICYRAKEIITGGHVILPGMTVVQVEGRGQYRRTAQLEVVSKEKLQLDTSSKHVPGKLCYHTSP